MLVALSIVFIFYRTLDLDHLERAIYSLAKQTDLKLASELTFIDNNTAYDPEDIRAVVEPHFQEPFVTYHFLKHGDDSRRHSWSANYGIRAAVNDTVFFTRADYILMEDCLERMAEEAMKREPSFISGWCWQMAAKRQDDSNTPKMYDHEPVYEAYGWRTDVRFLLQHRWAHCFHETDQDAGVYVTTKEAMQIGGWYDEAMIHFGYQQSTLQRRMARANVRMYAIPDYLFCHQHHEADRNFARALQEFHSSKGG